MSSFGAPQQLQNKIKMFTHKQRTPKQPISSSFTYMCQKAIFQAVKKTTKYFPQHRAHKKEVIISLIISQDHGQRTGSQQTLLPPYILLHS